MVDVHSPAIRSKNMAAIRSKHTKLEVTIVEGLLSRGFNPILHDKTLPGKPDMVLPEYNAVIFANSCFFHHHNCHLFKWPVSRAEFWKNKINKNKERDQKNYRQLTKDGWWILTVWECAIKGKTRRPVNEVIEKIEFWLRYEVRNKNITGKN